jgi:hypothetical protein
VAGGVPDFCRTHPGRSRPPTSWAAFSSAGPDTVSKKEDPRGHIDREKSPRSASSTESPVDRGIRQGAIQTKESVRGAHIGHRPGMGGDEHEGNRSASQVEMPSSSDTVNEVEKMRKAPAAIGSGTTACLQWHRGAHVSQAHTRPNWASAATTRSMSPTSIDSLSYFTLLKSENNH